MSYKFILANKSLSERICRECGSKFMPTIWNQIYCGSKSDKTGCSYKMHIKRIRNYVLENYKEYMKNYQIMWHKKQRLLGTPYSLRQMESKRIKSKTPHGKEVTSMWRKKNITKVLLWNKQRLLHKLGVEGKHTNEEWENLKKKYDYCCASCKLSENELSRIWNQKGFKKLTKDHIKPISRGGTDYIQNIQPLCVSCNARKWAEEVRYG